MKKKLTISLIGFLAIAVLPLGAAFEAHTINVTADIQNALAVSPLSFDFGTVFPQEYLVSQDLEIRPSDSFKNQSRVASINYVIKQKPKPRSPEDHKYCFENEPANPGDINDSYYDLCYPNLCPYLSKHKSPNDNPEEKGNPNDDPRKPNKDYELDAPHNSDAPDAQGYVHRDWDDWWVIDLVVPCFKGQCAQDWNHPGFELEPNLEGEVFGCDLWVEVTGFNY